MRELESLRRQAERDAEEVSIRSRTETEQLLAAARMAAEAVKTESEATARSLVQTATLEAEAIRAAAEKDAGRISQQAAEKRSRTLTELEKAQKEAQRTAADLLASATEQQRAASEHLTEETERAARLRLDSLAEAERVKLEATAEAEQIVKRAQQQSATIDERARQEFAWRRRQMRHEQDLLTRRKQAMLSQLTSLSALAAETAEKLPEVPDLDLRELPDFPGDDPAEETAPDPAPEPTPAPAAKPSSRQLAHAPGLATPARGSASGSEQAVGRVVQTAEHVVVQGDAGDAAVARQHPRLRLDLLGREHPGDGAELWVATHQLEVAGELLDPVDLTAPFHLHRDVAATGIAAEQVHRTDRRGVLPPDQRPALAQRLRMLGQQGLQVGLHAVLLQTGVETQLVAGVVEHLADGDLQACPRPGRGPPRAP